jgi:hypothetical protein
MKKLIWVLALLVTSNILTAQGLKKTEKIKAEQVPLMIREAFEKDFGSIPDGGYWMSTFTIEQQGTRSVAKPLSFTFYKKIEGDKIEVKYMADGKLAAFRGLEKQVESNT